MRLIFIRHGDPDYARDSVTEKGEREIALLAEKLAEEQITDIYISPLGRAQKTAQATLSRIGRTGETCAWLKEFTVPVLMPDTGKEHLVWDFPPRFIEKYPALYSANDWLNLPFIRASRVPEAYAAAAQGLDRVLEAHGYRRKGMVYEVTGSNRDTLVFFCHLGITGILLSHLFNMSPVPLLQHFFAAPSSVTVLFSEEREKGIAQFRCSVFGDTTHLYLGKEPPSVMGKFCEIFDSDERHE